MSDNIDTLKKFPQQASHRLLFSCPNQKRKYIGGTLSTISLCLSLLIPSPTSAQDGPGSRLGEIERKTEVRGMTVSCPRYGQIWGSDAMVQTMRTLKAQGVNWIAIHPYSSISGDGTVGIPRGMNTKDGVPWLERPIREAHRLGLKIMIKPHLAYWGSPFLWRGEIKFETEPQWRRFFATYVQWINSVVEICADADAFVVGTELDQTIHREQQWRTVITAVRARTDVPLTYAANWDSYQQVMFWDALDVIGVQAYFPLVEHDRLPETGELQTSWRRIVAEVEEFGRRHNRKIVFSELGYDRAFATAQRPWQPHRREFHPQAEQVQRHCLESALAAINKTDSVVGAFLWKWFPGEYRRGSHIMSTPAMRQIIDEWWGSLEQTDVRRQRSEVRRQKSVRKK